MDMGTVPADWAQKMLAALVAMLKDPEETNRKLREMHAANRATTLSSKAPVQMVTGMKFNSPSTDPGTDSSTVPGSVPGSVPSPGPGTALDANKGGGVMRPQ